VLIGRTKESSTAIETISTDTALGYIARWVLQHRRLVSLFWLVIAGVGLVAVGPIADRLTSSEAFTGLPSYQAGLSIVSTYGTGGNNNPIVTVITLPGRQRVDSPLGLSEVTSIFAKLAVDRSLRVLSYPTTNDPRLVSSSGRSTVGLVFGGNSSPTSAQIASRLRTGAPTGVTVQATSLSDLQGSGGSGGIGVLGEVVVGALGALIVLVLVFGSFLALVPLVVAFVSILGTFLLIGTITTFTEVSQLVEYLVALIGLGVAIDYSLIIVTRWREERARGRPGDDAVVVAMVTAGRSVVLSGLTVAVGLFALIALPVPFLRSIGYAGLLIPAVTVMAAITLLPVLLSSWGPRLDRRNRRTAHPHDGRSGGPSRAWSAWTRAVIRHRILAALSALIILGTLLGFAFELRVGEVQLTSLAQSGSSYRGLRALEQAGFPTGVLDPIEILVPGNTDPRTLAAHLDVLPGVYTAVAPTGSRWRRADTALVDALPTSPTSTASDETTITLVRQTVHRLSPDAQVAGDGPEEADIVHAYYDRFPLILAIVALISLLALGIGFRSVILPIKALAFNVLSVGAAYGALVLIWQYGYGSSAIWGVPATGVVVDFVPLLLFAFLFGLSMDYEVFVISRIRESYDATGSTDEAVAEGLGYTGRLVTSAAIIMFLAFAALAAGPVVPLKVFATGVGVGILLDATVVRGLLLPAVVSLLGKWNWWLPSAIH
jgi:RND superfamily putative drug exporter